MFIKDFKKYKGDEYGKNFTLNIGSKQYIAAAHETKFNCDQCGKNLATAYRMQFFAKNIPQITFTNWNWYHT